jgi:hypothetical protein
MSALGTKSASFILDRYLIAQRDAQLDDDLIRRQIEEAPDPLHLPHQRLAVAAGAAPVVDDHRRRETP